VNGPKAQLIAVALSALLLTGCASGGPMDRLLIASGLAPEAPLPPPATISVPIEVYAGSNLNSGPDPAPLAVVLRIFRLSRTGAFESARYEDILSDQPQSRSFSDDLIGEQEILLLPGHHYAFRVEVPSGSSAIALAALFRAPSDERWRAVFDGPASAELGIRVGVHACAMTVSQGVLISRWRGAPEAIGAMTCPPAAA